MLHAVVLICITAPNVLKHARRLIVWTHVVKHARPQENVTRPVRIKALSKTYRFEIKESRFT